MQHLPKKTSDSEVDSNSSQMTIVLAIKMESIVTHAKLDKSDHGCGGDTVHHQDDISYLPDTLDDSANRTLARIDFRKYSILRPMT